MSVAIYVIACIVIVWYCVVLMNKKDKTKNFKPQIKEVENIIQETPEPEPIVETIKYKYHLNVDIAGVFVPRRRNYILDYCAEGDELTLKHDKRNAYSKRAIAIRHDGTLIGYVPEVYCAEVMGILHLGPQCVIKYIYYTGDYLDVSAEIFIIEDNELSTD